MLNQSFRNVVFSFNSFPSHTLKFHFIPSNFIHRGYENPQFKIFLADDSHEISYLIFFRKLGKMSQNLSSAAVVIGALRVNK